MTNRLSLRIAALALIAIALAAFIGFGGSKAVFAATVEFAKKSFNAGLFAGNDRQFEIDRNGNATTSANVTVDGETDTQGFTQGGGVGTLTDANGGTYTLTEAEMLASNYLKFAAGGAGQATIALTFPATSTMDELIPSPGDCREWIYDASALSAATTTTLTAGAGHDVIAYTTNDDVIDGAEFAEIRMCRQADTDVTTFVSEMLNAD